MSLLNEYRYVLSYQIKIKLWRHLDIPHCHKMLAGLSNECLRQMYDLFTLRVNFIRQNGKLSETRECSQSEECGRDCRSHFLVVDSFGFKPKPSMENLQWRNRVITVTSKMILHILSQ